MPISVLRVESHAPNWCRRHATEVRGGSARQWALMAGSARPKPASSGQRQTSWWPRSEPKSQEVFLGQLAKSASLRRLYVTPMVVPRPTGLQQPQTAPEYVCSDLWTQTGFGN